MVLPPIVKTSTDKLIGTAVSGYSFYLGTDFAVKSMVNVTKQLNTLKKPKRKKNKINNLFYI